MQKKGGSEGNHQMQIRTPVCTRACVCLFSACLCARACSRNSAKFRRNEDRVGRKRQDIVASALPGRKNRGGGAGSERGAVPFCEENGGACAARVDLPASSARRTDARPPYPRRRSPPTSSPCDATTTTTAAAAAADPACCRSSTPEWGRRKSASASFAFLFTAIHENEGERETPTTAPTTVGRERRVSPLPARATYRVLACVTAA